MSIGAQDDIDKLLQNGYIFKEVAEQVRRAKAATQNGSRERLFGNGAPAKLPSVTMAKKGRTAAVSVVPAGSISASSSDEDQTLWFETRLMTGGSTNILDLSKKSLVERGDTKGTLFDLGDQKFMRGTVEFFGVNPTATNQIKNITLNFEGVDYKDNNILFPGGENANGTWRLQMKGVGSSGKITDVFKAKGGGDYLKKKVIAFTKIQGDYYSMAVFQESELNNFKAASRILARNGVGKKARQIGLL